MDDWWNEHELWLELNTEQLWEDVKHHLTWPTEWGELKPIGVRTRKGKLSMRLVPKNPEA